MPVPIKQLRKQLHVSGMEMLAACGVRFEFRYVLGIKLPPKSFLLKGSALDRTVGKNLTTKIETGSLMKESDVKEFAATAFEEKLKEEGGEIELDADEREEGKTVAQVLGEAKDDTVLMTACHHREAAPLITPKALNKKFSVNMDKFLRDEAKRMHKDADQLEDKYNAKILDERAVSLNVMARMGIDYVGEWDIVEEYSEDATLFAPTLVIRDTKSSGKTPTNSIAHESDQLTGYALATHIEEGRLPDKMVLDYITLTPKKKLTTYTARETTRDLDDVGVFLNRMVNALHAIRTGVFVPARQTDWQCSQRWCGYYDRCPYAKRPKLIQIGGE